MTTMTKVKPLSANQRHGRATNAIAAFLEKRLHVPNIYLDPKSTLLSVFDVFAVDGAGSGDFHAVDIKVPNDFITTLPTLIAQVNDLKKLPAHFKYLALPATPQTRALASRPVLFATNGLGRVGVLLVNERSDDLPDVELLVNAERFRVDPNVADRVAASLNKRRPDMFIRI